MVSDLFHSPSGVLFTFPSRYLFTIDLIRYLALAVSSARFTPAIVVLGYSGTQTTELKDFRVRDYYPLRFSFPADSPNLSIFDSARKEVCTLQPPKNKISWFWASPFSLAATCGILVLVSIPIGTEMFHFPMFASSTTYV